MTRTIRLNRHQVAEWQPIVETPNRVTSLSGHAIPTAVELRRDERADEFSITFEYPGQEHAGEVVWLDRESPAVRVALSKFTRKVVLLTVAGVPSDGVLRRLAERLLVAAADENLPIARHLSYRMSATVILNVVLAEKPQPLPVG
jgi:hypothetical protein